MVLTSQHNGMEHEPIAAHSGGESPLHPLEFITAKFITGVGQNRSSPVIIANFKTIQNGERKKQ